MKTDASNRGETLLFQQYRIIIPNNTKKIYTIFTIYKISQNSHKNVVIKAKIFLQGVFDAHVPRCRAKTPLHLDTKGK